VGQKAFNLVVAAAVDSMAKDPNFRTQQEKIDAMTMEIKVLGAWLRMHARMTRAWGPVLARRGSSAGAPCSSHACMALQPEEPHWPDHGAPTAP
jgi:hypothetical protein